MALGRGAFHYREKFLLILLMVLVAGASFGLGRLGTVSVSKSPVTIVSSMLDSVEGEDHVPLLKLAPAGQYVASKTGTKYFYPWCSGAQAIREGNKILFDTREEAQRAGYAPAGNCKGLK